MRFSFLLSAPVILAAGALKAKDLTGPMSAGMHGPILAGSVIAGSGRLRVDPLPDQVLQRLDKSLSPRLASTASWPASERWPTWPLSKSSDQPKRRAPE